MEVPPTPPLRVCVSICKMPREPFSIYGGKETMHLYLLMMTYRQDIMTNFSCMHDRYTVYPFFRAVFQNISNGTRAVL